MTFPHSISHNPIPQLPAWSSWKKPDTMSFRRECFSGMQYCWQKQNILRSSCIVPGPPPPDFKEIWNFLTDFHTGHKIKFHVNLSTGGHTDTCGHMGGQTSGGHKNGWTNTLIAFQFKTSHLWQFYDTGHNRKYFSLQVKCLLCWPNLTKFGIYMQIFTEAPHQDISRKSPQWELCADTHR